MSLARRSSSIAGPKSYANNVHVFLHALHGNTPGVSPFSTCWLASFNSDGLSTAGRWQTFLSYDYDILCLQETHLSSAKQKVFTSSTSLHCLWGAPVTGSSKCGVGVVVKPTKFAKFSPFRWPTDHPCFPFWAAGCLQAFFLYLHDNSALVLYNMSGARESASATRTLRQLRQQISSDAFSRALPAILFGDFNAESEVNTYVQSLLASSWCDLADMSNGPKLHTCHKGSGSRIDHAWCSSTARSFPLCYSLQANPFTNKGHSILEVALRCSLQAAPRLTPRKACSFGHLKPFTYAIPEDFHSALRNQDIDAAASIWSRTAEQALFHLHIQQDGCYLRSGQPRGKIQFDSTRQLPRVQHEHADSLQLRRLGRAFRQATEVTKCIPGTRADRTWRNLQSVIPDCPQHWRDELSSLLRGPAGQSAASMVAHILCKAMEFLQQSFRLKAWK